MHDWTTSPSEAIEIQQRLRPLVTEGPPIALDSIRTIAGIDAAYKEGGRAAIVVLTYPEMQVVDSATAFLPSVFPYVPGLLSFREGPVVEAAMNKLRVRPDLLMFDGQGYAHPRRVGLASHMGLFLDLPSIGCAKSRLVGHFTEPGPNAGDRAPLTDHGEVIGTVLRTKPRSNPLFISIGYRVTLEDAVAVVLRCLRGYRLPEPTRAAHNLAGGISTPSSTSSSPTAPEAPSLWDQPPQSR